MILDEPTNHLDIETLSWLEQYLQSYPGAILLVSHDRYFLDKIVTTVYEITRHRSFKYKGNYTQFLEQKAERLALDMKAYSDRTKLPGAGLCPEKPGPCLHHQTCAEPKKTARAYGSDGQAAR